MHLRSLAATTVGLGRRMPLYEYECVKCGERFERIQKFSDDPVKLHTEHAGSPCDGTVRKILSAPAIQFKGSGWYVTDYGKGDRKPPKEASEKGSTADTKPADSGDTSAKKESSSKSAKPPAANSASASVPASP